VSFEAVVSTDGIGALCTRLHLPPPAALAGSSILRDDDPDRDAIFDAAWSALVAAGLVADPGDAGQPLPRAIALLGAPETLVTIHRQTDLRVDAGFIAVNGPEAAEHQPLDAERHAIAGLPTGKVASRIAAFCRLTDRPLPATGPAAFTAAELLTLTELVAEGDLDGALALTAGRPDEPAARGFVAALSQRTVSGQVSITRYAGPGRIEGTSTAWVDGGDAGIWRIPRPTVSPLWESGQSDNGDLDWIPIEVSPVTASAVLTEIIDGFPELAAAYP